MLFATSFPRTSGRDPDLFRQSHPTPLEFGHNGTRRCCSGCPARSSSGRPHGRCERGCSSSRRGAHGWHLTIQDPLAVIIHQLVVRNKHPPPLRLRRSSRKENRDYPVRLLCFGNVPASVYCSGLNNSGLDIILPNSIATFQPPLRAAPLPGMGVHRQRQR